MSSSGHPDQLGPSKLGTKEYWDGLYSNELSNHAADPSDTGTVWFDDSDAEAKIVEFLSEEQPSLSRETTSFLDLGCGNGSLLLALHDDGWNGRMLGVDYSAQSVALATRIAEGTTDDGDRDAAVEGQGEEDADESGLPTTSPVVFREWDIIAGPLPPILDGAQSSGWDVVLDKGTFDAVSLSAETDAHGRRLNEGYRERALQLVRPGGIFLVTSCNWTETELRRWFADDEEEGGGNGFVVDGTVQYRTFSFGGVKGQTISTVCFRRRR